MATTRTFGFPQVQELCDHVVDLLESTTDLKSCALISPAFTSSAQRHLFRDVSISFVEVDIRGRSIYRCNDSMVCHKFCALMQESPHLLQLVRSLRASFAEGMLTTLNTVNFPNLREILLEQDTHGSEPDQASISAAAKLISISSVRHVALWSLNFRDLSDDFARLFTLCMPQLDSISLNDVGITSRPVKEPSTYLMHRVLVKTLTVQARYDMKWLLDARSPLDFSALSEFDGSMMLKAETIAGIFERAGASLVHLKLGTVFDPQDLVDAFTHIPCLSQLTVVTSNTAWVVIGSGRLIHSLPASNRLQVLTFEVAISSSRAALSTDTLQTLATALTTATFPELQRVEVNVEAIVGRLDSSEDIGRGDELVAVLSGFAATRGLQLVLTRRDTMM